jgi:hypothetical protein
MVSGWSAAFGIAAIASAVAFLAASIIASVGAAGGRANLRRIARVIGLVAAAPLLILSSRPAAQPFVAFAVVAALPAPQPLALALAAGAAIVAGLAPSTGLGSVALAFAGAAAAIAAHALGRSLSAYLGTGRDVAWPASAAGATACALVIAVGGGGALRWTHTITSGPGRIDMPDAGLVLGLTLLASLGGALLLGADALAVAGVPTTTTPFPAASPLARMLGRRALLLAAGLSVIAAGLVFRASGETFSLTATRELGILMAIAGLLSCVVPPLLAERIAGDALDDDQAGTVISRLVVVVALAAVFAAAAEGWLRSGTYLTPLTARLLSASLVAFAASETMHLRALARAMAVAALLLAVFRAGG